MRGRVLLTGATGNTGRVVAERLLARGWPVTGLVRSEARQRQLAAMGIDTVMGDFDDPKGLVAALSGFERAYLVCTPDEHLRTREISFIRASVEAGVSRIVKCSAFGADPLAPTQTLRNHAAVEAELIRSGIDHTIVRPHGFMQTFTQLNWPMIERAGVLSLPAGDGGIPLVDVRDVAEVVLCALTEPGHEGRIYDITGPEVMDMHTQAAILTRALGRPIHYVPAQEWQLSGFMRMLGVAPVAAEHALTIFRLQREHHWKEPTTTLRELGVEPTSYAQFVQDLLAGRTGGGSSFEPPSTRMNRLLMASMPVLLELYRLAHWRRMHRSSHDRRNNRTQASKSGDVPRW